MAEVRERKGAGAAMLVLQIIGEAIALVFGSLVAAALFSWLCWNAFKLVRHPEWGVPLCLLALLIGWGGAFAGSAFLRLAAVDAVLAAVELWPLGLAWRRRQVEEVR